MKVKKQNEGTWRGKKGGKPKRQVVLLLQRTTDGYQRGGGGRWVKWVMGIKEGTCDEHWALYMSNEITEFHS